MNRVWNKSLTLGKICDCDMLVCGLGKGVGAFNGDGCCGAGTEGLPS